MTPPDRLDLDELASATLDGEPGGADAARLASDERLARRVEEFRSLRRAIREPVTALSPEQREALLAAVLDAAEPPAVPGRRTPLHLAAAAAVVAVAFLAGSLVLLDRDDRGTRDAALQGSARDLAAQEAATTSRRAELTEPGSGRTTDEHVERPPSAEPTDLGAHRDLDELRSRLALGLPDPAASYDARGSCGMPDGQRRFTAVVGGRPVEVRVGPATVTVYAADDCTVLGTLTR
jgi:hypothetical protein